MASAFVLPHVEQLPDVQRECASLMVLASDNRAAAIVLMRFFAGLLAYLVGASVLISIAVAGYLALLSPADRTPAEPVTLAASNKERPVDQVKPVVSVQKKTQSDRKNKVVHTAHKRVHAPPNTVVGGDAAYGYAEETHRRIDPNLFFVFGR